jgi:hypothetical protein
MINNYKYFLLENSDNLRQDTTLLSEDDLIYLLKKNCKNFNFNDTPIWRNTDLLQNNYLINPKLHTRKSVMISNYYTLLIDNSPYWEGWPKRSKSIIGLLNNYTSVYGSEKFRLIPFDGAKIAVASKPDLWGSFTYLMDNLEIKIRYINIIIRGLYNFYKENINDNIELPNDDDFNNFKEDMKPLEDMIRNIDNIKKTKLYMNSDCKTFYDKLFEEIKNGKTFVEFINEYLKPNENEFKLTNYKKLVKSKVYITGNEVWTDSKCLLIHAANIENIKEKYDTRF